MSEIHQIRDNVVNLLAEEPYLSKDVNLFLLKYWSVFDNVKGIKEIMTKGTPADLILDAQDWATGPYSKKPANTKGKQQYLDF